jgi:hypothetical protein
MFSTTNFYQIILNYLIKIEISSLWFGDLKSSTVAILAQIGL